MPARVIVSSGSETTQEILIGNTASIGRTNDNTIHLPGNRLVSREHALLRCHNGYEYQLVDLGSLNGTYLDGERVVTPRALRSGASIRIAEHTLIFTELSDPAAASRLDPTIAGGATSSKNMLRWAGLLVCDIRGFSSKAEQMEAAPLAQMLGSWFRDAAQIIQLREGVIDKFIGDAVLAYWPGSAVDHGICRNVSACAVELAGAAAQRRWADGTPFRVAVALHAGTVSCGNVGVDAQRDATIIGDAVNTVFRLESVMKSFDENVLASEAFRASLPPAEPWRDLGEQMLRGKEKAIRAFGRRIEQA